MGREWRPETADRPPHAKAGRRRELCRGRRTRHPGEGPALSRPGAWEGPTSPSARGRECPPSDQLSDLGVRGHPFGPTRPASRSWGPRTGDTPRHRFPRSAPAPQPQNQQGASWNPAEAVPTPRVSRACPSERRRPCRHREETGQSTGTGSNFRRNGDSGPYGRAAQERCRGPAHLPGSGPGPPCFRRRPRGRRPGPAGRRPRGSRRPLCCTQARAGSWGLCRSARP